MFVTKLAKSLIEFLTNHTDTANTLAPQMVLCRNRPKQATMLSYFTTDAAIGREALRAALGVALDHSFNRIIVDGDTSTNDTMVILANGMAGNDPIVEDTPEWQ